MKGGESKMYKAIVTGIVALVAAAVMTITVTYAQTATPTATATPTPTSSPGAPQTGFGDF